MKSPWPFNSRFKRFAQDERGTVALIFGLSILPVMGLTGAAVDYSRASLVRTELQAATDATALALAKDSVNATTAEINVRANAIFNANFQGRFSSLVQSLTVTKLSDRFRVEARARVDFTSMQLFGPASTDVNALAVSGWAINKIEIALALDNTGSMGWSNKMVELKKALCGDTTCSNTNPATGFIKEMRNAAVVDNQIRIALVPFDTTVRVPLTIQNALRAGTAITDTFSYTGAGYCNSNPTTAERVSWTMTGVPTTSWFRSTRRDKDTTDVQPNTNTWIGKSCDPAWQMARTAWNGCVWDRDQDNNRDIRPSGVDTTDIRTLYPIANCRWNTLARMAPLVDVRTSAASLITSLATMQPSGNTNVTIGTTWGVNMLTPGAPMSTAIPAEPNLSRIMILLTDGDNTENRTTGNSNAIDARTRLACANAKAPGQDIEVYAVRVIDGNRDLLRECASSPSNYYEVADASQLDEVFKSIARKINGIRLTN